MVYVVVLVGALVRGQTSLASRSSHIIILYSPSRLSITQAYRPECYYYDIIDLIRRLILTGGLIMIGGEDSVAQVLLGIFVSALWLCLVLYKRPYVAFWDNALSAMLSFVVMSTLLCGMALRQYELTKAGKDDNEQGAFGVVLVLVNAVSLAVSLMVVLVSTSGVRQRLASHWSQKDKMMKKIKASKTENRATAVLPRGNGAALPQNLPRPLPVRPPPARRPLDVS